ncbi:protein eiger [Pectinophora gossypiella]|nr:protein eiger [Pectinophora gossypiella]
MAENRALIPEPVTMYTQTESLNEVKDLSKNLVSGDFERQYRAGMMEKGGRRRPALAVLGAAVCALAVWLLVLTLLREVQLARLRHQVDELSANMIALTANVKSLNQKVANNRVINVEDTIYADEVEDPMMSSRSSTSKKDDTSLEKLEDLTVLEDDIDLPDDEDMYDEDDDIESGDWYLDYDKRRPKDGTTNMVRLKPEDFSEAVLTLEKEKHGLHNTISELKRLLNENPENPNIGLPALATSESPDNTRSKRSVFPDSSPETVDQYAAPKSVSKTDERRKTKKFAPPEPSSKVALHSVIRTVRSDEEGVRRPFVAAHFHGNTSHLSTETHEHYKGNGLLKVAHGAPHDVWYPSPWTIASPHPRPTLTRNGHVHVHHTGVYLVYVQIYYLDSHDVISWVLHRTNPDLDGRETLLQCAQSAHSPEPMDKPNSCFSAAALFLKAGDRLAVRNTGGDRHSLMQPEKSFIGLVKLADAEDPDEY